MSTTLDAISALATAGALIAAIAAARQAKQLFDIEAARDERAEESARREHATQISAWAAMQILSGGTLIHGIIVRNASHDPVYDVQATCHGFTRDPMPRMQCVPPGEYFIANKSIHKPDGKVFQWDFAKPVREIRDPVRPFTASDKFGVDMLTFRDRAGLDWVRTPEGALHPRVDQA